MPSIFLEVLAGVIASLLGAGGISIFNAILEETPESEFVKRLREFALGHKLIEEVPEPAGLFKELTEASRQMDIVVSKIQKYTAQRESAVQSLESQLSQLTAQEGELREKIRNLQAVPLPAAEYFAKLIDKGEQSSAKRDYALFTAGVIVSVIVAIILKHFRLA
jgi:hypothetical protein